MTIAAFGLTDVGKKRRHNEDAYLLDVERGLFVVADGMGGHAAGEVASRITVESIQEFIAGTEEEHENTWPFGFNNRYSLEGNRLTTAVEKANEKVMRAVQNRPELKGMGTTVVAALFDEDRVTLVHVGDSRAYLYRGRELKRLTDDHSWVQEQVNAGILSEDEAKSHPLKNVVTRALGGAAHVAVDLIEVPINTGDRFLLCSDGLTGMVSDDELVDHLSSTDPPDRAVRSLIELANERGGIDNITAILVEVVRSAVDHRPTDPIGIPSTLSTESTVTVTPLSALEPTAKINPASVTDVTAATAKMSGAGDTTEKMTVQPSKAALESTDKMVTPPTPARMVSGVSSTDPTEEITILGEPIPGTPGAAAAAAAAAPEAKPAEPAKTPEAAAAPTAAPSTPPAKAETTPAKPETPAAKPETRSEKAETPSVKADTPSAKADTPPAKTETPSAKTDTPSAKAETPSAKAETTSAKTETPPDAGAAGSAGPKVDKADGAVPEPATPAPSAPADEKKAEKPGDKVDGQATAPKSEGAGSSETAPEGGSAAAAGSAPAPTGRAADESPS